MNVRLVDLLGLPSADALDPERSWRPRPRALSLRAPIGRAADGEILELDLKQAAEGGMGPHGVLVGATGSGKSELLRSLVAGLAATPRARAARLRARRLQGRRRVRRPLAAAARGRPDHQPAARPVARRPHARRADRRAGAAPDDAARGRQPRRHRLLPGAARGRSVDAADARPAGDRRRVRRAAGRAAGVHRPVRRVRGASAARSASTCCCPRSGSTRAACAGWRATCATGCACARTRRSSPSSCSARRTPTCCRRCPASAT